MSRPTKSFSIRCIDPRALVLAIAGLLVSVTAHAQDATATALFKAGKELAAQGNYKDACPKFEASYKHEALLGTLMNMADCHEKVGAIARAWSEWGAAYENARKAADAPRADLSKRRQDALEPRVPKLKVTVTGSAPGLEVWRDDRALDSLEYDVDLPIELGRHTIRVKRGTAVLESQERVAEESAHLVVSFDIAKIAADHPAPVEEKKDAITPHNALGITKKRKGWPDTVGPIAIIGGGVIALLGVGLEIASVGLKGNQDCSAEAGMSTLCTQAGLDKIQGARSAAVAGIASLVIGPIVALAGAGIYLFGPRPDPVIAVAPIPGGAFGTWGMRF